jgi:hypothetical protein
MGTPTTGVRPDHVMDKSTKLSFERANRRQDFERCLWREDHGGDAAGTDQRPCRRRI